MCNKAKVLEKEGITFLLTLPIKHKNRIVKTAIEDYLHLKSISEEKLMEGGKAFEKCKSKHS